MAIVFHNIYYHRLHQQHTDSETLSLSLPRAEFFTYQLSEVDFAASCTRTSQVIQSTSYTRDYIVARPPHSADVHLSLTSLSMLTDKRHAPIVINSKVR